ncbi:hypothetical protein [Streptomyces sp. SAS_260]|uniref:hypothetical protein n=1 Tax=Streptomyces sp. SAS_260 TaxID=3412751 RepID=UPI00403C865F
MAKKRKTNVAGQSTAYTVQPVIARQRATPESGSGLPAVPPTFQRAAEPVRDVADSVPPEAAVPQNQSEDRPGRQRRTRAVTERLVITVCVVGMIIVLACLDWHAESIGYVLGALGTALAPPAVRQGR